MIKLKDRYGSRTGDASLEYPNGTIVNESYDGANDGTPLDQARGNDIEGFYQALMIEGGVTPSGDPDTALASDRLDAMKNIIEAQVAIKPVDAASVNTTINGTTTDAETYLNAENVDDYAELRTNLAAGVYGVGATVYVKSTGGPNFVVEAYASQIDDGGVTIVGGSFAAIRNISGEIYSSWFESITGFFSYSGAVDAYIDGQYVYDNSSTTLSFQSDVNYIGINNARVDFADETQRLFVTTGKSGFSIKNLTTNGNTESMETSLGGGYWRFESCSDFNITGGGVSKTGFDGIKLVSCDDFFIKETTCKWNKSTAITAEACTDFKFYNNTLSKNGRNSSDDSYADLPTGWTGTHVGRGITLVASSAGVPCTDFEIYNNTCKLNSEYGIRSFGQSPLIGNNSGQIYNNICVDNGAPKGTYGTIILASDKGADILVNTSTAGASYNIDVDSNKCYRKTLPFGTCISVGGNDHSVTNNRVYMSGAASYKADGYLVFDSNGLLLSSNKSSNAENHLTISPSVSDISVMSDTAKRCYRFIQGYPASGDNSASNNFATHASTAAIFTHDAVNISSAMDIENNTFDGFYYGIELSGSAEGRVRGNKTKNSVSAGFRNYSVDSSLISISDNSFDSVNPFSRSTSIGESVTPRGAGMSFEYTIPTSGFYRSGHFAFDSQPDSVSNGRKLLGWLRLTEGTNHVNGTDWQECWVETSSTS